MSSLSEVGDLFLLGLRPTPALAPEDRALLAELRPAGIIVYKSNFRHDLPYEEWHPAFARLLEDARVAIGRDRIFVGIDHEGGRVCRTPPPLTRFDYPRRYAAHAGPVARAMGRELASIGANLDFAPLLDVHSNPDNPVIGERAFGTTPAEVIPAALAFAEGLAAEGVVACGKHFPGHGDTSADSHLSLPVLDHSLEALRARELLPFAAAAKARFPMIMTAHVSFPRVDPDAPATFSRALVHDLLRGELGYEGVVVSDDLGMGAVARTFDDPRSAVRLVESGSDLLMVCAHFASTDRARGFAGAILGALADGTLAASRVEAARARVHALLATTPQPTPALLSSDVFAAHRRAGPLFDKKTVEVV